MNLPKHLNLKAAVGLILISVILTASIAYYVFAATPSSTFWIEPGVYPGAPSYTVWRDGSYYYAKDENGHIPTWAGSTNATTTIQNAIDDANFSVYIKAAIYPELCALTLKTPLILYGDKWNYGSGGISDSGTVLKAKASFSGNLMSLNGTSGTKANTGHLILRDFAIILENSVSSANGIYLKYCARNTIENLYIRYAYSTSIYLDCVEQTTIKKCYLHAFNDKGIYLYYCGSVTIIDSQFSSSYGTEYGIQLDRSEGNSITGNTFYFVKNAIHVYNLSNLTDVSDNSIWRTTRDAIYLQTNVYKNLVTNNRIFDCGSDGSYSGICINGANHTTILGNIITNYDSTNMSIGITEMGTSDFNMIMINDCQNVTTNGILVVGASTKVNLCWNASSWIS